MKILIDENFYRYIECTPMKRKYEVFPQNQNNQLLEPMFLGQPVNVARYDQYRYSLFEKLTEKQLSFFWRPEEVNVTMDGIQYKTLSPHEKHIFLSNLKYQTLMDSIQGRSPNVGFLPIVSLPELETWVATWTFSETIHSRSYTHIIRAIEPIPDVVFNDIVINEQIKKRAKSMAYYYDQLHEQNILMDMHSRSESVPYSKKEHMHAIYMALQSVNALEAIRFYVSFACSFAFAERELMEGNAKIIKFIARDEALHLVGTQRMILSFQEGLEGEEWAEVAKNAKRESEQLFLTAVEQEIEWANYLFKDGAMLGLNAKILTEYVYYLAGIRMKAINLDCPFDVKNHPIPWVETWFSSDNVQVAPQEVEMSSYLTNQIDASVDTNALEDIDI